MSLTVRNQLFISLLLMSSPLCAQEGTEDVLSLSLAELMEIEITGSTLTPERLKTVPSAVTIFTDDQIKRMGLDTLDELMNLVPGFQSMRNGGSPLFYIYSSRARRISGPSSEILLLVDGQRIDGPRTSGSALIVPKYPLQNIKRVEFIRGPGSTVYGSNAMLGVINIITSTDVNAVNASYGSYNRKQVHIIASQQSGVVKLDLFAHLDNDEGDNYRVQDTFSPNVISTEDPRELANVNLKFRWHNTQVYLQHYQYKAEDFYETGNLSNGFNERKSKFSSVSLKQNFDWQSVNAYLWLSYHQTKTELSVQVTSLGALENISEPPSNAALFLSAQSDDFKESRVQWHNDWDINEQSSLKFGIEYRHIESPSFLVGNNFDLGDLANGNFPIRFYDSLEPKTVVQVESNRDIAGFYTQYQYHLLDLTHFTLGLRYDEFSNIGSKLSPRIGIVHEISDHQSLKMLYAEAFRAPAESELGLVNNPSFLGNPDLEPETVKSWDLIWLGQWQHTSTSLGYFENHFENAIIRTANASGALQTQNIDQDPVKGVEFELSHEWNNHWLLRATYTHIFEKADLSFREADKLASLLVNYQRGSWNANVIYSWHGESAMATGGTEDSRIKVKDYGLVFINLSYNFNRDLQVYVQGKNLLDHDYQTPPESISLSEGIPNRGREMLTGITWSF